MKTCINCGESFESKQHIQKYCSKICGNRYRNQKHYHAFKEKHFIKRVIIKYENIERWMLARVKSRAKTKGIVFNLEADDIKIPKICPVLGITLNHNIGRGSGFHSDSPSVDRIDPKLGYIKGNVRVISARANLLKSDATITELVSILEDLRKLHETPTES